MANDVMGSAPAPGAQDAGPAPEAQDWSSAAQDAIPTAQERAAAIRARMQQPQKRDPILILLTVLLVIVGVAELGLLAFAGIRTYQARSSQAAVSDGEEPGDGTDGERRVGRATYSGPWIRVEEGVVVWRWEDDGTGGLGGGTSGIRTIGGRTIWAPDEYPRTPASPPRSWVWTVDPEERISP